MTFEDIACARVADDTYLAVSDVGKDERLIPVGIPCIISYLTLFPLMYTKKEALTKFENQSISIKYMKII